MFLKDRLHWYLTFSRDFSFLFLIIFTFFVFGASQKTFTGRKKINNKKLKKTVFCCPIVYWCFRTKYTYIVIKSRCSIRIKIKQKTTKNYLFYYSIHTINIRCYSFNTPNTTNPTRYNICQKIKTCEFERFCLPLTLIIILNKIKIKKYTIISAYLISIHLCLCGIHFFPILYYFSFVYLFLYIFIC